MRARYAGDRLRCNTVKIHFDGINELRTTAPTAVMLAGALVQGSLR